MPDSQPESHVNTAASEAEEALLSPMDKFKALARRLVRVSAKSIAMSKRSQDGDNSSKLPEPTAGGSSNLTRK